MRAISQGLSACSTSYPEGFLRVLKDKRGISRPSSTFSASGRSNSFVLRVLSVSVRGNHLSKNELGDEVEE